MNEPQEKKIILIIGTPDIGTLSALRIEHQGAMICHRENLHEFDESLRGDLLRAIELEEAKKHSERFLMPPLPDLSKLIAELYTEKKGKHTHRNQNKYLWKK